MDGVFENRTAACIAPYADAQGGNAPCMFTPDQIRGAVHRAGCRPLSDPCPLHRRRRHPRRHRRAGGRPRRQRPLARRSTRSPICNWSHPDDLAALCRTGRHGQHAAALGLRLTRSIPNPATPLIGPARCPHDLSVPQPDRRRRALVPNSDWAVSTLNPFEIIDTAVTRATPARAGPAPSPSCPHERLTVERGRARLYHQRRRRLLARHLCGALRPGLSADFIVLDRDIFTCDARRHRRNPRAVHPFQGPRSLPRPRFHRLRITMKPIAPEDRRIANIARGRIHILRLPRWRGLGRRHPATG